MVGAERIIGVSCHACRHLAMEAADAGADYVAFGAFFASSTKASTSKPELDLLSIWRETTEIPCVAIGGVTADNCAPLVAAGADLIAVSAGVWRHPEGPLAAARALERRIEAAMKGGRLASPEGLH